jgi:hypothetical protein
MASVATEQQWKDRYRDLVGEIEEKERAWHSLEAALRAAAGKLAVAALGQSPEIDAAVDHVMATLRVAATPATLDSSLSGLVRALQAQSAPPAHTAASPATPVTIVPPESAVTDQIVPLLRGFIDALGRIAPLAETAAALDRRLELGSVSAQHGRRRGAGGERAAIATA